MNEQDVKELLCQQMQLLAEKSKECTPTKDGYYAGLREYSETISHLADSYTRLLEI